MADFITNLWEGVFTPGPTPTLLIATNVTFAALQLVLGGLLLATYSIHFLILSILSGGLWWAINWFAIELQEAQRKEEEAEKLRNNKKKGSGQEWKQKGEVGDSADDEGGETETEERQDFSTADLRFEETEGDVKRREDVLEDLRASGRATQASSTGLKPASGDAEAKQRKGGSESGELSTDSEWEKVDEER